MFYEISFESIKDSFFDMVICCHRYYILSNIKPLELTYATFSIQETKPQWKGILLILELCHCPPSSNATLECFFSHVKLVKTTAPSGLSCDSLNSIICIRMNGPTLTELCNTLNKKSVKLWNTACKRRPGQRKKKIYSKKKIDQEVSYAV